MQLARHASHWARWSLPCVVFATAHSPLTPPSSRLRCIARESARQLTHYVLMVEVLTDERAEFRGDLLPARAGGARCAICRGSCLSRSVCLLCRRERHEAPFRERVSGRRNENQPEGGSHASPRAGKKKQTSGTPLLPTRRRCGRGRHLDIGCRQSSCLHRAGDLGCPFRRHMVDAECLTDLL